MARCAEGNNRTMHELRSVVAVGNGIVHLVGILEEWDGEQPQLSTAPALQAAWVLNILATFDVASSRAIVNAGGIPRLVALLRKPVALARFSRSGAAQGDERQLLLQNLAPVFPHAAGCAAAALGALCKFDDFGARIVGCGAIPLLLLNLCPDAAADEKLGSPFAHTLQLLSADEGTCVPALSDAGVIECMCALLPRVSVNSETAACAVRVLYNLGLLYEPNWTRVVAAKGISVLALCAGSRVWRTVFASVGALGLISAFTEHAAVVEEALLPQLGELMDDRNTCNRPTVVLTLCIIAGAVGTPRSVEHAGAAVAAAGVVALIELIREPNAVPRSLGIRALELLVATPATRGLLRAAPALEALRALPPSLEDAGERERVATALRELE